MRTVTAFTTLVCVVLLALPASSAWANATDDKIIADCQNSPTGALTGSYTAKQLNHAWHNLPGDIKEYTGCPDAIKQAVLAAAGADGGRHGSGTGGIGGGGGTSGGGDTSGGGAGTSGAAGGGSGSTSAPPADTPPPPGAERPVAVAGATIAPGALPEIGKDSHSLPTALVVLLGLLGVAVLVPAGLTIGRRVVGHRGA